jgi:glycerol-3-phosphate dehydrogenase
VANYVGVSSLLKDASGAATGAAVRDELTGDAFEVHAKYTINATGPYADSLRAMADASLGKGKHGMISPSTGTHVVVAKHFVPSDMGLLVPKTHDGRVLFYLPWV